MWPNWLWTTATDTYYNVGDGFLYPMNTPNVPLNSLGRQPFSFYFSTVKSGFIDFQFVAQDDQRGLIGAPKLYAMNGQTTLKPHVTMNNAQSISCGSTWDFTSGSSNRNATAQATYDFHYQEGNWGFNTKVALSIGNWWATPYSSYGDSLDVGIPLNLTVLTPPFFAQESGSKVYLKDYKITLSSIDQIQIGDRELSGGHAGSLMAEGAMVTGLAGVGLLAFASVATAGGSTAVLCAIGAGTALSGAQTIFSYTAGQQVSDYTPTWYNGQRQLVAQHYLSADLNYQSSTSNLVFMHLNPSEARANGMIKVVLSGTLVAYEGGMNCWEYPLADIEVTIAIPWFIF